jgi:hypothetical protein
MCDEEEGRRGTGRGGAGKGWVGGVVTYGKGFMFCCLADLAGFLIVGYSGVKWF